MKASRWQEYFEEFINGEILVTPISAWADQRAEQEVKNISLDESIRATSQVRRGTS